MYQTALHNKRNEDQFNRSSPSSPRATRANGHLYKNPSTDLSTRGTASLNLSLKPRDSPQTDNKKGHSRRKGQHVFKGRVSLRSTFQSEVEPEESGHAASPRLPSNPHSVLNRSGSHFQRGPTRNGANSNNAVTSPRRTSALSMEEKDAFTSVIGGQSTPRRRKYSQVTQKLTSTRRNIGFDIPNAEHHVEAFHESAQKPVPLQTLLQHIDNVYTHAGGQEAGVASPRRRTNKQKKTTRRAGPVSTVARDSCESSSTSQAHVYELGVSMGRSPQTRTENKTQETSRRTGSGGEQKSEEKLPDSGDKPSVPPLVRRRSTITRKRVYEEAM